MVITGAISGIGRVTVLELTRRGGSVVLTAQSKEILEVDRLAAEAVGTFGKIDVWLNDGAMLVFGEFTQILTEDFRIVLETNLFGFIYGAWAAVCQFYRQGYGTLINMGSCGAALLRALQYQQGRYPEPEHITWSGVGGP